MSKKKSYLERILENDFDTCRGCDVWIQKGDVFCRECAEYNAQQRELERQRKRIARLGAKWRV